MASIQTARTAESTRLAGAGIVLGSFFTAFLPLGGVLDQEMPDASACLAKEVPLEQLPGSEGLPEWKNATLLVYRDHTEENGEGCYVVACREAARGEIPTPRAALRVRLATPTGRCAEANLMAPIFAREVDQKLPGDINELRIEVAPG